MYVNLVYNNAYVNHNIAFDLFSTHGNILLHRYNMCNIIVGSV